ncbi:MAG: hypothetical protein NT029_09505 [Armatimonadetes bacterium]|nr:hypothetical protein [Armatimonadota bacterium]
MTTCSPPTDFWRGWDEALTDERLVRVPEPPGLTGRWRALCAALPAGACADTDVYLAALAVAGDFTLVTFDHGFARFAGLQTELFG